MADGDLAIQLIISAAGAIAGGLAGAILTNRGSSNIERLKQKKEAEKESEFNTNVQKLIHDELRLFANFLLDIHNKVKGKPDFWVLESESKFSETKEMLEYRFHYMDIPFEIKAKVFKPDMLDNVEHCYFQITEFRKKQLRNILKP